MTDNSPAMIADGGALAGLAGPAIAQSARNRSVRLFDRHQVAGLPARHDEGPGEFCDLAVDLNPIDIGRPTLKADWNDLTGPFGAVVGDGVVNLAGYQLADKMLGVADLFIARVFLEKLPGMKYATHFPKEFPDATP